MKRVRHREVWADLRGAAPDKYVIMGRVTHAMKQAAVPESTVDEFREAARKTRSVPELIELVKTWVEVSLD